MAEPLSLDGSSAQERVVTEILAKHAHSRQPESQQLCAALAAILDVVGAQGLKPNPASIFAAIMASLESSSVDQSTDVTAALTSLLSLVMGRVPDAILRKKFQPCVKVLRSLLDVNQDQAAILKSALACLGLSMSAADPTDWPSAAPAFQALLQYTLDARPKVRKQAQTGLGRACGALHATPAAAPAGDAVLRMCQRILPGPEAAARAAAAASSKQRTEAEAAISTSVTDALHLLGALTAVLPLLTSSATSAIVQLLQKLYFLRQPLLSRHATAALTAVCSSPRMDAGTLSQLLASLLDNSSAWEGRDSDTALSLAALLQSGLTRLHGLEPSACSRLLSPAVHALLPQLASAQEGVRLAAARSLTSIITTCLDDASIAAAVSASAAGLPRQKPPAAVGVTAAIAEALGPGYQSAWPHVLPVATALLERLGRRGAPLASPALVRLGDLCAGAFDAAQQNEANALEALDDESAEREEASSRAEAAMGAAIRALGPEAVLAELPLNLLEGLEGKAEARTWLLPMLRSHVRHTHLAYWGAHLLPLARALGSRASAQGSGLTRMQCSVLEGQLWGCLPAFALYPLDGHDAFRALAQELGTAFQRRSDLRAPICAALQRLCTQCSHHVQDASNRRTDASNAQDGLENSDAEDEGVREPGLAPEWYTSEIAERDALALRTYAKNWLPLLFNAFVSSEVAERGPIAGAISAYATIADAATVATFFRTVMQKLIKATQEAQGADPMAEVGAEGGDTPQARRCTYLDLALCLAPGLDDRALHVLVTAALPALQERDQALQKRAYRLLAHACDTPTYLRAHTQALLDALLAGVGTALSAAKRWRLRCLRALVLALQGPEPPPISLQGEEGLPVADPAQQRTQVVSALVGEIVLCVKEVNQKTRAAAFELLVSLARAMHEAEPPALLLPDGDAAMGGDPTPEGTPGGGLARLLAMVMGGLVGGSPHMVSASVMALARLLHEHAQLLEGLAPRLLQTTLLLLRTKSREVVKSVLGFCKVCAMRMPAEQLQAHLGPMLEGLLIWAEDSKNKFRLKVRAVVERLVRRCGLEAVARAFPPGDSKLLAHVRRQRSRRERLRGSSQGATLDGQSLATRPTPAGSTWGGTRVFGTEAGGGTTVNARSAAPTLGRKAKRAASAAAAAASQAGGRGGVQARKGTLHTLDEAEPMDLLDHTNARVMAAAAARAHAHKQGGAHDSGDEEGFASEGGRMIINDERADPAGRLSKRKTLRDRLGGEESDLEDEFDDLRVRGNARAKSGAEGRSTQGAPLSRRTGVTRGAPSRGRGGGSRQGTLPRGAKRKAGDGGASMHSGDRFKARKTAGGDVKGSSKVEPYAYWPLDRKMLNRRAGKQADAAKGLSSLVHGARKGAAAGAKRQQRHKRRR